MEVRQLSKSQSTTTDQLDSPNHTFPLVLSAPINGRIIALIPFRHPSSQKDYIFFLTENKKYAVISYATPEPNTATLPSSSTVDAVMTSSHNHHEQHSHNLITHASGDLSDYGLAIRGTEPENGSLVSLEPNGRCIALHLYEGYVSILPILLSYRYRPYASTSSNPRRSSLSTSNTTNHQGLDFIGPSFHCRIEERDVFSMEFLIPSSPAAATTSATSSSTSGSSYMPQLGLLHQDSRGLQHVIAHSLDMRRKTLIPYSNVGNGGGGTGVSGGKKKNDATTSNVANTSVSNSNQFQQPPMNQRLKKNRVEGGSGVIIPVPPNNISSSLFGGILVLGHRSITYHSVEEILPKVLNMAPCFIESYTPLVFASQQSQDMTLRFLLGDNNGKMHILAVVRNNEGKVTNLHLDTLGEGNVSSSLVYLENGTFFLGSQYSDSQLIQILDEPVEIVSSSGDMMDDEDDDEMKTFEDQKGRDPLLHGRNVTFLNVVEEFINLGPIVDFDLVPTTHSLIEGESKHSMTMPRNHQSMAITASGAGKDGSLRLVSNGIGMTEHAAVDLPGIKGMFNIRKSYHDVDDAYLIQSYVGETRVLGVVIESDDDGDLQDLDQSEDTSEIGATLEEVEIVGINSHSTTLFAGNLYSEGSSSLIVQITETEIKIVDLDKAAVVCDWCLSNQINVQGAGSNSIGPITVASANELGQIVLAVGGGTLIYLQVSFENSLAINFIKQIKMDHEISCLSLNPLESQHSSREDMDVDQDTAMMEDNGNCHDDPKRSYLLAVGLWDECHISVLSLRDHEALKEIDKTSITPDVRVDERTDNEPGQSLMARSLCFVTLKSTNSSLKGLKTNSSYSSVNMLLVGLGDGGLVNFVVENDYGNALASSSILHSRKEVSLGTRAVTLVPFHNHTKDKGTCVLATGDRPTVIYLAGGGKSNQIPKLCYSNINLESEAGIMEDEGFSRKRFEKLVVNVATPFHSTVLFSASNSGDENYSLCISDESTLRLGMIDDIQKLHVATHKLGMAPRRITHHESGRVVCVSCIDDDRNNVDENFYQSGGKNEGNCIRFFDDASFEEIDRIDLDHFEIVLSMVSAKLKVKRVDGNVANEQQDNVYKSFLVVGTAYSYPDEDEPTRGRIILIDCSVQNDVSTTTSNLSRRAHQVNDIHVSGGVYSLCKFYNGTILATINSKTRLCKLFCTGGVGNNGYDLKIDSAGHRGNILSLHVNSMATQNDQGSNNDQEQIAIVGDLARSISVIKHYPEYGTLEEIARDFNQNWVTAIEMLNLDTYLGGETFHNLFVLRRNSNATSEEVRSRLDTSGLFNVGEMVNKFVRGSLVIPQNSSEQSSRATTDSSNTVKTPGRHTVIRTGSQTLFGTIDGTIGSIIGLDLHSFTFLSALERAMSRVVTPVGNLTHDDFRAYCGERRQQGTKGFVDGDLIESFIDLDRKTMQSVVEAMIKEDKWKRYKSAQKNTDELDEESRQFLEPSRSLTVSDVVTTVEEISMLH